MKTDDITTVGLLLTCLAAVWKILGYVFDLLMKKKSQDEDGVSEKLDTLLKVSTDNSLKLEKMDTNMNHAFNYIREHGNKIDGIKTEINQMKVDNATLLEWKRNKDKEDGTK